MVTVLIMENKLIKQFQVEELEQRLEMGRWTLSFKPTIKIDNQPGKPASCQTTFEGSMTLNID